MIQRNKTWCVVELKRSASATYELEKKKEKEEEKIMDFFSFLISILKY